MAVFLPRGVRVYHGTSVGDAIFAADGGDIEIYGFEGDDLIWGADGNDWLFGGYGNDRLVGWEGDDHLYGEDGDDELFGVDGADTIFGGSGRDVIYGGTGIDAMYGGTDNDWSIVDHVSDSVVEFAGQGIDIVWSYAVTYTLSANVENLSLFESAIDGTGNGLNNIIHGNSNNNWIWGRDGDDDLYGEDGSDHLYGGNGWDILVGGAGHDTLDGGAWFDDMYGGTGDDVYVVDHAGDWVIEYAGEGLDAVESWLVSYTLADNVENLYLFGSASVEGYGNSLGNIIEGNSIGNMLSGLGGNDTLYGWGGDDSLVGGAGSDYMRGGTGNDGYYVDSTGDSVIEYAGEGEDTVSSWISYTLGTNVEHLRLYGGAINGTGNALANDIDGNGGNNVLRGEAGDDELDGWLGNDTMYGGTGHDVFHVDQAGDVVIEYLDQGIDEVISTIDYTLAANVENLRLLDAGGAIDGTGNGLHNTMWGNASSNIFSGLGGDDWLFGYGGNNSLSGDSGADTLVGGAGADMLYGGTGDDWFVFESAAETTDGFFYDHIMDFSSASSDKIDLRVIDANSIVAGNQAFSYIGAAAFSGTAGQLKYVGGFVQGDTNGDSIADFMIETNAFSLSASDFLL